MKILKLYSLVYSPMIILALIVSLPFNSVASQPHPTEKALEINGYIIPYAEYQYQLNMFTQQILKNDKNKISETYKGQLNDQILKKMIGNTLLFQYALQMGIEIDAGIIDQEVQRAKDRFQGENQYKEWLKQIGLSEALLRNQIHKTMVADLLIKKEIIPNIKITDDEIKTFYEKNITHFKRPEEVHALHILLSVKKGDSNKKKEAVKKKLVALQKRILEGEDFAALAKKYSQDKGSKNNSDLGYFAKGIMVKPFEEAAFKLKPNEVSDIVETEYGYHLIKVLDHRSAIDPGFEKSKPKIRSILFDEKLRKELELFIKPLREKAKIQVFIK